MPTLRDSHCEGLSLGRSQGEISRVWWWAIGGGWLQVVTHCLQYC
jgi:hypothetical protein